MRGVAVFGAEGLTTAPLRRCAWLCDDYGHEVPSHVVRAQERGGLTCCGEVPRCEEADGAGGAGAGSRRCVPDRGDAMRGQLDSAGRRGPLRGGLGKPLPRRIAHDGVGLRRGVQVEVRLQGERLPRASPGLGGAAEDRHWSRGERERLDRTQVAVVVSVLGVVGSDDLHGGLSQKDALAVMFLELIARLIERVVAPV